MTQRSQKHVFISYVRENQNEVSRLCDDLSKHGVHVWLDREKIKAGTRWKDAVREAIRQGDYFIACFSKEYASRDKSYMNEELAVAVEELRQFPTDRVWFIPVLLSECDVPARSIGSGQTLLDIQWVPLFADWDIGIQRIIEVIKPIPVEIQNLLHALQSRDVDVRLSSISALTKFLDESAAKAALIRALKDEDSLVRRRTAESLASREDPSTVRALIERLRDDDSGVRKIAVSTFHKFAHLAEVPDLIIALNDVKRGLRSHAIQVLHSAALERVDDASAVPALISALSDNDSEVRWRTALVLGKIRNPAATPAVLSSLQDEYALVRECAALALGKIGDRLAVTALMVALKDKDAEVRWCAAVALGKIGDSAAIPALREALEDEKVWVCKAATGALHNIDTTFSA